MTTTPSVTATSKLALQQLILDEDLEHLEDLLAEFNLFDVLKIERRELQQSALLAWLLDPTASHGLQDYFLRRFLTAAAQKAQDEGITGITPLNVDAWDLANIEVATERHNIDVLLISQEDEFVCIIENKIGASEHSNQLNRYLATVEHEYQGLTRFPIFLTPDGMETESNTSEPYVPLGYEVIEGLIKRTLETRGSTISSGIAQFLEQYARTLGRHVMTSNDNIDTLALQIYQKHREAIDLIIKAKPAFETKGWSILDSAMERHERLFRRDFDSRLYHRFYAPDLEEIRELHDGKGWTESGRMLLFQVNYRERSLVLELGPGPEPTRKSVYELTQDPDAVPGVSMRRAQKLSGPWHRIYRRTLLGKDGSAEPDYEKGRSQVETEIATFIEQDYWPLINAIRVKFGLPPVSPNPNFITSPHT